MPQRTIGHLYHWPTFHKLKVTVSLDVVYGTTSWHVIP